MLIKLAWRNVWRNPRRSILTIAAVAFGLALCIYTYALAVGYHNQMVRDAIQIYAGHIQVHALEWEDNQTLEYLMDSPDPVMEVIKGDERILGAAPRAEVPGLISRKLVTDDENDDSSGEENTTFAVITGVEPEAERKITVMPDKIRQGRFLSDDDPTGVIIGEDLAATLDVGVGDRILLWTQNYYESLDARYYFVRGTFKTGNTLTDTTYVFAPLSSIQQFLKLDDMVTTVAIRLKSPDDLEAVANSIRGKLDLKIYETLTWEQFMPELKQYVVFDDIGAYIFLGILVIVVVFGILNTQLMTVLERTKEFGTMLALGARPGSVALLVLLECGMMTGVGILIGNVIGFIGSYINTKVPINMSSEAEWLEYFGIDPRMYAELTLNNFIVCSAIILVLALLMSIWPAMRAARYRPVEALRYV